MYILNRESEIDTILSKALAGSRLGRAEVIRLLRANTTSEVERIFSTARLIRK